MSIFRRRKKLVINEPDPSYNVIYLGNVLTVLAKGEACTEKPLTLIWKTYCSRTRPDIPMTLTVTPTGLKAVTKQQGLTEYWAHRITYCSAPSQQYPRLFCWIYKHEGKKLKPELRCHAVLCKKSEQPQAMALLLHEKISAALRDYKREKIARQNIRLSGTVAGYPSVPQRKILLSVGGQNFRPPMNRSKSAPRLHSIEECGHEEEEEEDSYEDEEQTSTSALVDAIVLDSEDGIGMRNEERDEEEDELNVVRATFVPGTPREVEFRYRCPFRVDLEIGNDVEKIRDDERIQRLLRRPNSTSTTDTEADSISDESGYHDEKSSVEEEDDVLILDDSQHHIVDSKLIEQFSQVTAL